MYFKPLLHSQTRVLLILAVCLSLLLPAPALPAARAQSDGPTYTVQLGDTLYGIALNFGLTVEALQAANNGIDPAALGIGQTLIIPGFEGITGSLGVHSLQPGENLDSLALKLGLARDTLVRLNRLVNPNQIYVSENIVVVAEPDAGAPIETGQMVAARPGRGLLSLAAARGQSAWGLAAANRLARPTRLAPGAPVLSPGGERPTSGLVYPLLEMRVGPLPAVRGQTLAVTVITASPTALSGEFAGSALNFNTDDPAGGVQVALQGIYRLSNPDLYPLSVSADLGDGSTVAFWQTVPVRAGDYGFDLPLTVNPTTLDPAFTGPETDLIRATVAPVTPQRHWSGTFALPSVGLLRSVFGSLRSYNGGPYDSFHGGVDFSGGEDRPITAPAPGIVVLTEALTVRGNSTIIDHGWGVYSGYWHQSAIEVEVGQRVETGQVIGFNGATGRVTGPHLHWELWIGGMQVDGLQWTQAAFP